MRNRGWILAAVQNPLTGAISNQPVRAAALENNCYQCHPGKETQCLRGAMFNAGILCSDCHGTMDQIGADFSAGDPKATPIVPANKLFTEPAVPAVFNDFINPAAGNPKLYRVSTGHGGMQPVP